MPLQSTHMASFRFTGLVSVMLVVCGCTTPNPQRWACSPPTGAEFAAALGYQQASRSHLLGFRAEVDDRPLYVEAALVAFELPNSTWRMAHVFRRPDEDLWKHWEVADGIDAPGVLDLDHRPTRKETEQFLRETRWHSGPDQWYRLVRSDEFHETWREVFGYVPSIPRKDPYE